MSDIHSPDTHSPLASKNPANSTIKKIILIILMLLVVSLFIAHHYLKPPKTDEKKENTIKRSSFFNRPAPQLIQEEQVKKAESFPEPLKILEEDAELEKDRLAAMDREKEQQEMEQLKRMRMVAPTTVYSASSGKKNNESSVTNNEMGTMGDANSQFMTQTANSPRTPVVHAGHIAHPRSTLAQGTMIWATIESRISSDLPGMIRAITSEDIYGEDGSRVLLPKGSKLIGQYLNAVAQGQERVFVVWQRAIRPDHMDIQLNSYGTDPLGTSGMAADHINRHFFQQFGQAILLSIISAGAANMGVSSENQFNSSSAYREAIASSVAESAQKSLKDTGAIQPTLTIDQGKKISVFVSRDLDFDTALELQRTRQ